MKMLSGCKAPHCDKDQFCDKMTVITWTIFEISLLNIVVLTRWKMALSQSHTFAFSCLPRGFGYLWVLLIIKALKEETRHIIKLLAYLKLYGFSLCIAYIARQTHYCIHFTRPSLTFDRMLACESSWGEDLKMKMVDVCLYTLHLFIVAVYSAPFSNVVCMHTRSLIAKSKATVIGLEARLLHVTAGTVSSRNSYQGLCHSYGLKTAMYMKSYATDSNRAELRTVLSTRVNL